MVGPEFVRILRGHCTGPKPEDNFTNLAIPNQRDSKRHVNSKARELAVHSESIDLSTAFELLKGRHEQGHKQAFMVLSADAIYAGKVKLVPECINGSIIGAVDKHVLKLLEKKLQAKSRTISTKIPEVEDETGGGDECSSGSEKKSAIWNEFLKNATETSSTLTELVAQLDENIFEISLRGIPQNQSLLEAVLKNTLKLQQDWTLLQLPPADQVLAVALADSTGAVSTIVCHHAISKTDAKLITFALFLEIIQAINGQITSFRKENINDNSV
ncbi:hypothetical protein BDR26DRAFT_929013 [Obelidium mucronatum]|nr:hypothetical protein BDR26DRAFT_929013 [Obelidium mucronatum]